VATGELQTDKQYRLAFSIDGENYASTFISPITTTPIDSIYFTKEAQGKPVSVFVATHDDDMENPYYKWRYDETWQVRAPLFAGGMLDGYGQLIVFQLNNPDNLYNCWGRYKSDKLLLASTKKQAVNAIDRQLLTEISCDDDRISILYRITLEQTQLHKEAYLYFEELKKHADLTGGLFSPIPSGTSLRGNIRCESDTGRLIMGYVDVATTTKMNEYLWSKNHYLWYEAPLSSCYGGYIETAKQSTRLFYTLDPRTTAPVACLNCTTRPYASKVKPADWPTDDV
jgi:hypothetical protein